jgi:hypothetical protein
MSINPLDVIPPALHVERRRSRRIDVLLQVEVEIGGERRLARLTELSRAGARIEMRGSKSVGEYLTIRRAGFKLQAQVVWADPSAAGLWFPEPLVEERFLQLRRRTVS